MMRDLLLVGGGGFLGSVARYYITGWATQLSHAGRFPVGTLAVNVTGCLVALQLLLGLGAVLLGSRISALAAPALFRSG